MKLLFVCTGNTCRSPMAEGLLNALAKEKNLTIEASSAGLRAFPTAPVSLESIQAVKTVLPYLDISNHRARTLTYDQILSVDEVITMTTDLKLKIQSLYPNLADKVKTLSECAGVVGDVQDPYGYGQSTYDSCGKQIYELLLNALPAWQKSIK